ncbi:hypothetical protein [Streptomyces sp. NPDC001068]|uniref:hypothetical protein n=1 Tax=Streptomyces sp. NPDC001068 TaxID=3364544 RepID=UPI0036B0E72F
MTNWADLDESRWAWSAEAVSWLRARLRGVDEALEDSGLAHVMVLGDSQVGKTTLLLRLLGVTDPEAAAEAASPLRAGRGRGRSATPVPIRYQWSGDPERWSLAYDDPDVAAAATRETVWLTSEELEERLASFRTGAGDRLLWRARARPLEIGLPDRFAGPGRRPDLRVFDLPGLHGAGAEEREAAKALLAAYSPVMDHVVFVVSGNQFGEMVRDPAVTENPFLLGWSEQRDRFSMVFTRAFSAESVGRHLRTVLGEPCGPSWQRDKVIEAVQAHYAEQVRLSDLPALAPESLFLVELGDSWTDLLRGDPEYAVAIRPVCDELLRRLSDTVARYSDPDRRHLAAAEIAARVEIVVRDNARRRERALETAVATRRRAERAHAEALALHDQARRTAEAAGRRTLLLREDLARLAEWPVICDRPEAPEMRGTAVRAKQEEERAAWTAAARRTWTEWRGTVTSRAVPRHPPHDLSTRTRERYDALCACCQLCEQGWWKRFVRESETPEYCYARMTAAGAHLPAWIRATLHTHADAASARLSEADAAAGRHCAVASRHVGRTAGALVAAVTELDGQLDRAAEEEAADSANLVVARSVRTVHDERNRTFVQRLARQAAQPDEDRRYWLLLAALRGIHDLNRMFP